MRISTLTIENLRNIKTARLQPGPSFNLLHGDNGAGKTSVIESLVILAKGRSFRGGTISSLIGPEQKHFLLVGDIEADSGQSHRVGLRRDAHDWEGRVDGADLKHLSDTARYFPLVLMEPTSHQLVSAGPDFRRRFMDWGVFHVKHDFLNAWRRYTRAVKQRNAALRSADARLATTLDPQLESTGQVIHEARRAVGEAMFPSVRSYLSDMSPKLASLRLTYQSGWRGESLPEALQSALSRDLERGNTSVGPHRADIQIRVGDRAVRDRLSRGEQKILAAAMLLAQAKFLTQSGHVPVMLLDDLASEFDQEHLRNVIEQALALGAQLFVTGTDKAPYDFVQGLDPVLFHVKHGEITRVD